MIKVTELVIDNIEEGELTIAILLDFSKAFDCLNHKLNSKKVELLGVGRVTKKFFKSYLEEIKQLWNLSIHYEESLQK